MRSTSIRRAGIACLLMLASASASACACACAGVCGDGESDVVDAGGNDGGDRVDADVTQPAQLCTAPIAPYDTASPTATVGTGSAASCTEAALRAAAEQGGVITFDCGAAAHTIDITQTIDLPVDTDTIIDGAGLITLDAGGRTRHLSFDHPDWMNNATKVVLQRLRFIGGNAPAGPYFPQDTNNPNCAYGYKEGSGGAIYMRNGVLHVIESVFENNHAALVGPDVGGGAIYVLGVPELIVVGSRFSSNRGANAGAIGMLFAGNPQIYNSVFDGNTAEGTGANYVEPGCPNFNHDGQGGAGGNGGAIAFDGLNDDANVFTVCGSIFGNNRANELAGAVFRTPNAGQRRMRIELSVFDGNTGRLGGVSFIKQNDVVVRSSTFLNNRSGVDILGNDVGGTLGGLWINEGTIDLENSTFFNNQPTGLNVTGSQGTVTNATFVNSRPEGDIRVTNSLIVDTTCGSMVPGERNVQWPSGGACAGGTSFADPGIGAIADNGGVTPSFLPANTSAVDGVGSSCPTTDQRGQPRNAQSCAAGAVEP